MCLILETESRIQSPVSVERLINSIGLIPARGHLVDDEFFSTVPGLNFDIMYDLHDMLTL